MNIFNVGDEVIFVPEQRLLGQLSNGQSSSLMPGGRYNITKVLGKSVEIAEPSVGDSYLLYYTALEPTGGRPDFRHRAFSTNEASVTDTELDAALKRDAIEGSLVDNGGLLAFDRQQAIIDSLIGRRLRRIDQCEGGWRLLLADISNGRLWELSYPRLNLAFVGPRRLTRISCDASLRRSSDWATKPLCDTPSRSDPSNVLFGAEPLADYSQALANGIGRTPQGISFYLYGYTADYHRYHTALNRPFIASADSTCTGLEVQAGLALPRSGPPPNCVFEIRTPEGTSYRFNPSAFPRYGQPGGMAEYFFFNGAPGAVLSDPITIADYR
jgi:hypothetical protein